MARKQDIRNRTVAITGGARGIGLATALAFLEAGANVAIGDIDADLARSEAKKIGAFGHHVDVSDAGSFSSFLDATTAALGPLDIMVNNAGIMPLSPLVDESDEVSARILSVNLLGAINGTKLAIARMTPRGQGHIINVASAVGRFAAANAATYSATKFGVVGLTQAVRGELHGSGVTASVILPATTRTDLGSGLAESRTNKISEPSDVARTIVAVAKRPRFETWVPRSNQRSFRVMQNLPYPAFEAMARLSGASTVLADADRSERAGYEERARR